MPVQNHNILMYVLSLSADITKWGQDKHTTYVVHTYLYIKIISLETCGLYIACIDNIWENLLSKQLSIYWNSIKFGYTMGQYLY